MKYYMIINTDKLHNNNPRRYLTFARGMFSNDTFGWSYELHALLFTKEGLNHPNVINYLKDYNYDVLEIDDINKLKRIKFFN